MAATEPAGPIDGARSALDRRIERTGWALFLIMIGGLGLIPDRWVSDDTWLIGTGVILLGVNLIRQMNGIRTSRFTIVLGIIALTSGISSVGGIDVPVIPLVLILIGAVILYRVMWASKT